MSEATDDSELWMVPYADLMSTLVILFLMLYGSAALKHKKDEQRARLSREKA